jgi:DNA polymerase III delta prime subunit
MPTLKDVAQMTSEVDRLSGELHTELTEGEIDFNKMVQLADSLSEHSDRLAAAFQTMAQALEASLASPAKNGNNESSASDDGSEAR